MRRFAALFWVFSLLAFLVTMVYTHSYLPRYVNIGEGLGLEKTIYFYTVLTMITCLNGAALVLGNAFQFLPSFLMPIPKRNEWMSNALMRKKLYLNLKAWTKGLACIVNLLFIIAMLDIYDINDSDIFVPTTWMYSLGGVLLSAWFVTYYFWFNTLPDEESLQSM